MMYTINKGSHFSSPKWPKFHCNVKAATFSNIKFSKECWHDKFAIEHSGVNKLLGFGYGFNHHNNSIRIGWKPDFWNTGMINLYTYVYSNGERDINQIDSVMIGTSFDILFNISNSHYLIAMNENLFRIEKKHNIKWGFMLKPCFGGESTTPVTMNIEYDYKKVR